MSTAEAPTGEVPYQSLYRRFRPQTFSELRGQEHVALALRNAVRDERVSHAYLFSGPRGTGKTSTARILAKALNCADPKEGEPCGRCDSCIAITRGSSFDVHELDAASNNGVDAMRDLIQSVHLGVGATSRRKVYIVDEVHMLSAAAFNALLKTLEEPPPHVKFVFATTDAQKVLPTILSRCQRFDLKPIPPGLIAERLRRIAAEEKIVVSDAALACIARLADGGMRDAQSIFEQMISFCGGEIAEPDVLDVYGLVSAAKVAELGGALAAGDHRKIVALVDEFDSGGRDLVRLLADLQALVREALLDAIAQGGSSSRLGAVPLTTEQITRLLDGLREGESNVKLGLAEKVNFEVALLKAVESSRARAIDSLIKELSALAAEAPDVADASANAEKKKTG